MCFSEVYDTLVIHSIKCGWEISAKIASYEKSQNPASIAPVKTEVRWTCVNDSIVKQDMAGEIYYGLIKGNEIVPSDENGKEKVLLEETVRDSAGFKITEYRTGNEGLIIKTIYDSIGRMVENYHTDEGGLNSYCKVIFFNDTASVSKVYYRMPDSTYYAKGYGKNKSLSHSVARNKVTEWLVLQTDSLGLSTETYFYHTWSVDHRMKTDSSVTISHKIFNGGRSLGPSSSISIVVVKTYFTYNNSGQLIYAEKRFTGDIPHKKEEMTITYKKRGKKKN